jgi:hypothetical protein
MRYDEIMGLDAQGKIFDLEPYFCYKVYHPEAKNGAFFYP